MATTRKTTTTPAKSTPAKKVTPASPSPAKKVTTAKATPAKATPPAVDLDKLASAAKVVTELPKMTRGNTPNPFAERMAASLNDQAPIALPEVPNDEAVLKAVETSLRKAADSLKCGVSIRKTVTDKGGVVVTFQAGERKTRNGKS